MRRPVSLKVAALLLETLAVTALGCCSLVRSLAAPLNLPAIHALPDSLTNCRLCDRIMLD